MTDTWADHSAFQMKFPPFPYGLFEDAFGLKAEEFESFFNLVLAEPIVDILDFGCGTGLYRGWYPKANYVGVDASPAMIAAASQRWPEDRFVLYDGTTLPFESASFDLVVSSAVLQHKHDRDKMVIFPELRRVLRTGGRLVFWEETFGDHRPGTAWGYGMTTEGWKGLLEKFSFEELIAQGDQHAYRAV